MEWIQAMVTLGSVAIGVGVMIWKGGAFVANINMRFDGLEKRMDNFEIRMDKFEIRMDKFEIRMDKFEARMDKFEERLNDLSSDVIKIKERLRK